MNKYKIELSKNEKLLLENLLALVEEGLVSNIHKSNLPTVKRLSNKLENLKK